MDLEITDSLICSLSSKDVKAVWKAIYGGKFQRFRFVRIIHGKGWASTEITRKVLSENELVKDFKSGDVILGGWDDDRGVHETASFLHHVGPGFLAVYVVDLRPSSLTLLGDIVSASDSFDVSSLHLRSNTQSVFLAFPSGCQCRPYMNADRHPTMQNTNLQDVKKHVDPLVTICGQGNSDCFGAVVRGGSKLEIVDLKLHYTLDQRRRKSKNRRHR